MGIKRDVIDLGFRMFGATGLHRLAARYTQGLGAILMFHRVRPAPEPGFAPNAGLEITPEFLDQLLLRLKAQGYRIVSLDEAVKRIRSGGQFSEAFVALTFDDGYRDTADIALPVLERHEAPFTVFVTTGFADRTARMWWVEMEEAIAALPYVRIEAAGRSFDLPAGTAEEKQAAFEALYWPLRRGAEAVIFKPVTDFKVVKKRLKMAFDSLDEWWACIEELKQRKDFERTSEGDHSLFCSSALGI